MRKSRFQPSALGLLEARITLTGGLKALISPHVLVHAHAPRPGSLSGYYEASGEMAPPPIPFLNGEMIPSQAHLYGSNTLADIGQVDIRGDLTLSNPPAKPVASGSILLQISKNNTPEGSITYQLSASTKSLMNSSTTTFHYVVTNATGEFTQMVNMKGKAVLSTRVHATSPAAVSGKYTLKLS